MSQTLFLLYRPEPARPMSQAGTGGYGIRPYVFCRGGEGRVFPCCVCRGDHWSPANLPPQRIFRDSCLVRQAGTGEQCSPLQEFSPVWARNIPARRTVLSPTACGRSPLAEGAKRGRVFACCACKRIYLRFRLVKNHLIGILFLYKSTGKPGANRRRKAIGAHRVSQLPTRNCCFTAAGSFASFWGRS